MSSSSSISSSELTPRSDARALAAFLARMALFAVPVLIYMLIVVIADPFRLFDVSTAFSTELKNQTARPINPCLWKLIYFDKHPSDNILLGDSRMENLQEAPVEARTGKHYANLAYGGATLNEIIDTFWFAANRAPLKNVAIGMNLNVFNGYSIYRRTEAAESFMTNRLLYFTNRNVAQAVYHTYRSSLTGVGPGLERIDAAQGDFWDSITAVQELEYSRWTEPVAYRVQLRKIVEWCRQHGVTLTFVIFPSHQDIQAVISKHGLTDELAAMKKELAGWGRVVDFEVESVITRDRARYRDPAHVTGETNNNILLPQIFPPGS